MAVYGLEGGAGAGAGAGIRRAGDEVATSGAAGEHEAPKKKKKKKSLLDRVGSADAADVAAMKPVLRSKGYLWLDTMPDFNVFWSQAGRHVKMEVGGPWWAVVPRERWPKGAVSDILEDWKEPFGDRETELVVIGREMDKAKVAAALQKCLLTPEEISAGIESWK